MSKHQQWIIAVVLLLTFLSGSILAAKHGATVKVKGVIISHTENTLVVRTSDDDFTVVLNDATKIRQSKGSVSASTKQNPIASLVPGLKVTVEGVTDGENHIAAKSVTFKGGDLQTAQMVHAGVIPTEQKNDVNTQNTAVNTENLALNQKETAANKQEIDAAQEQIAANRMSIEAHAAELNKQFAALGGHDLKAQLTVNFAVGSTELSADAKKQLTQLANDAVSLSGYKIQVKGFADSGGDAAANQKLSLDRAQAVIVYLIQNCNVSLPHIETPGAMGVSNPVTSNETANGRAENRRVEVRVFVNRATNGESN